MYKQIILTVGTSLFAPFNELGALLRQSSAFEMNARGLENVRTGQSETEAIEKWLKEVAQVLETQDLKNKALSAEVAAIQALERSQGIASDATVHLFYTDSLEGRIISRTLQQLLQQQFHVQVSINAIQAFDVKQVEATNRAMGQFLIMLCERMQQYEHTAFVPIGGYKVITTTAYMAGAITKTKTYYIPEGGHQLHALPLLPVTFPSNQQLVDVLQKIHLQKQVSLSSKERQILTNHPNFTLQEGREISLNALGYYYLHTKRSGVL